MSSTLVPLTSTFTSFPSKQLATSTNSQFISKTRTNQTLHGFKVSCNASPAEDHENQLILPETQKLILPNNNVDRRNLLVGLGGLYTTASLTSLPSAFARPIRAPDITNVCKDSASGFDTATAIRTGKCCPPSLGKKVKPFKFPKEKITRVRWPAHLGTKSQVDKYLKAIAAMRALPDNHPHSFASQAKIHCAYCNGGYTQVDSGFPDVDIQIHNSWLFFPFHRWYLYFYERILGNLINDPTFALPYWNWDDPVGGMTIPDFFLPENSPAYDVYRDAHAVQKPQQYVDLAYNGNERGVSNEIQKQCNLITVYRDLVSNATDSRSFFGGEYRVEDQPIPIGAKSIGSVEANTHTAVHRWVGDSTKPNNEDMGNFYSAGYDPLFYIHHTNVDRMWKLWKDLGIRGHNEPCERDWRDASYVFYDENQDLVRVYNKDCVKLRKLNYDYFVTKGEIAWRKSRPGKRNKNEKRVPIENVKTVEQLRFPVRVDPELKVRVKRPAVNRTEDEKEEANELLLINGIRFNTNKFVKFDVFVNDNIAEKKTFTTPCDPEYAGSFSQIPHNNKMNMLMTSSARFGLNEILEDTKTEGEEYALVTLVARAGCDDLTVADIKIELVPIEDY